jgi:drug/metabolite transporter (DMT)-like permease
VLAVALALAASLSWGIADFVAGIKSRALPVLTVMALSQTAGLVVIAMIVAGAGNGPPGGESAAYAVLAALGGLGGLAAFYRGMSVGAMAVVAPVSALAAVIPVAFGVLQGERPSGLQAAGIAVALAGVALASREEQDPDRERSTRIAAGTGLALLAAAGFGSFFVAMGEASEDDALWAILVNRIAGVTLLGALVLAIRPVVAVGRTHALGLLAVGVLDMSANTLYALASREGLISLVAVVASLYPVVVVGLAHFALGERVRPAQYAGAAAALGGVALIVTG